MKEKLRALLARLKFINSKGLKKVGVFFQWFFFLLIGTLVSASAALTIWVYLQPVHKLRPKLEEVLKIQLGAESASIGSLRWKVVIGRLGLGIEARDVVIARAGEIEEVKLEKIWILSQPIKIISGRLPLFVEFSGAQAKTSENAATEKSLINSGALEGLKKFSESRWAKIFRLNLNVVNSSLNFTKSEEKIGITKGEIQVSGFPGEFSANLETQAKIKIQNFDVNGSQNLSFKGFFQTWDDKVVGFRLSELELDLAASEIGGPYSFFKPSGMIWDLNCNIQSTLNENFTLKHLDILDGKMNFDESKTQFIGFSESGQSHELKWFSGPEEMESFNIPLKSLYDIPFKGFFEVASVFRYSKKSGFEAQWKMEFNNFVVKMVDLKSVLDTGSTGEVRFSFVNQVQISGGKVHVPRAEFQLAGSESQIELKSTRVVKPGGDAFELLVKAATQGDTLVVQPINVKLNNLSLDSQIKVDNFSAFVLDGTPGNLSLDVVSNPVDLTQWTGYLPFFRKVPLEGVVQFSGSASGPVYSGENPFREISWRVDRMSASKIRGAFDQEGVEEFGIDPGFLQINGPFVVDFLFTGRGVGKQIHRGSLLTQTDLTRVGLLYRDWLRKPVGTPLVLDLSVDQQRNRLTVRRGSISLHESVIGIKGQVQRGANIGRLDVLMDKPISLASWREFFPNLNPDMPLEGEILWNGHLMFQSQSEMEGTVSFSALNLLGEGKFTDLSFPPSLLRFPIRNLNGSILIKDDGIFIPDIKFRVGKSSFVGSGRGQPIISSKNLNEEGNLSIFWGRHPWDISGQLNVDNLSSDLLKPTQTLLTRTDQNRNNSAANSVFDLRPILENPSVKESKLRLRVRAKALSTEKTKSSDLGFIVDWQNGIFQMEPFRFLVWGGEVNGAFNFNARPFYERKEKPLWVFRGNFSDINLEHPLYLQSSRFASSLDGDLTGQAEISSNGFDLGEIWSSAQGRLRGTLQNTVFKPLKTLDLAIEELAKNSPASDYFPSDFSIEKCFANSYTGTFDGNFSGGAFVFSDSLFKVGPEGTLKITGDISADKMNLTLGFSPGSNCIAPRISSCLPGGAGGRLGISSRLTGKIDEPEIDLDPFDVGNVLVDCLRQKQIASFKNTADEAGVTQTENLREKISERWKRLFRGE